MKCPFCNFDNLEDSKFCAGCGKSLSENAEGNSAECETEVFVSQSDVEEKAKEKVIKNGTLKKKIKIFIPIVAILLLVIVVVILFATRCEHEFSEATCDTPPICSLCGRESGKPLNHDWKEADCTNAKVCIVCDKTEGEKLGHKWKEATCSEPKTCERCGKTDGDELGHVSKKWSLIKESNCSTEGSEKGKCVRCKEELTREIEKLPHKEGEWEITQEATVEKDGIKIMKCTVCGEKIKEEKYEITDAEYKAACGTYSFNELARNPSNYKGKHGKFYGKAIQVMEQNLYGYISYTLRVALNGSYDKVILVSYFADPSESHILEDDYITLYGEIEGTKTYETVMGANVTVPYVDAKFIEIR